MIETIDSLLINNWLKYGPTVPNNVAALFKLVWSDDQYEMRTGTYTDWVDGTKIREYTKTELVPKYNYLKERWILEMWFGPEVVMHPELPDSKNGSYECIYVFEDSGGNILPLNLAVVQLMVRRALMPQSSAMLKKSLSEEKRKKKEEVIFNNDMEVLNDEGPLVSQFHDGSAILNALDKKPD